MPKTNIKDVLKHGTATKVNVIDYSTGAKKEDLKSVKKQSDAILKSKDQDMQKMTSFVIKK